MGTSRAVQRPRDPCCYWVQSGAGVWTVHLLF